MDINFINICIALATIFVGYIFGSFPSSIVLSKLLGKDAVRKNKCFLKTDKALIFIKNVALRGWKPKKI